MASGWKADMNGDNPSGIRMKTASYSVDDDPVVLVAIATTRKLLRLTVLTGGDRIYIGEGSGVSNTTGFPILADTTLELDHFCGEVYAVCAAGESGTLRVLEVMSG